MKRLVLAMACLALVAGGAFAGDNDGAVLTVHGDQTGAPTNGDPCTIFPTGVACEDLNPNGAPGDGGLEWIYAVAAGANPLSFNTVTFGVGGYNPGECYVYFFGPCRSDLGFLELPSAGWPGPNTGTSVTWAPACLTGMVVPVYYFGIYVYGPGVFPLADSYPGQSAAFVDCNNPPQEDPVAGFGSGGCGGAQGTLVCPQVGPVIGACCFPDGSCMMLEQAECEAGGYLFLGGPCDQADCPQPATGACCRDEVCVDGITQDQCEADGGVYQGDGSTCDPDPCIPVPTREST